MTNTNTTPRKSPGRNPAGRHRARTLFDNLLRAQQRACRKGHHRYGKSIPIGAGIHRCSCTACGSVSIDLRDAPDPLRPPSLIRRPSVRPRA